MKECDKSETALDNIMVDGISIQVGCVCSMFVCACSDGCTSKESALCAVAVMASD
jgi:hypothetical protein